MPGRAANCSAVAVLRSTRWASAAGAGEAFTAGLAGALAGGAFTAAEAEWTGVASRPAATRRDSRDSARRDRIIVFEPPGTSSHFNPRAARPSPNGRRQVVEAPRGAADARSRRRPRRPQVRPSVALSRAKPSDMMAVPMSKTYDAIVIGGGHNGLTHAAYLARAGRKVLVLERRPVLGGAAVTEEIFPGFKYSVCSYVVSLLRPEIIRELDLPRHGLEILPLDGTFTPMPNGDYLWRMSDHARTRREIYRHSPLDAEAYDEYSKAMADMARFVKPILSMVPPDPMSFDVPGFSRLFAMGRRFQRLSRTDQHNILQLMTMSAVDLLDQWFETDVLKATMSASGIIGTFLGVRSPGTAYVLLHHYMGEIDGVFRSWGFSRGGTGAISMAIAAAAQEAGVEVRTAASIERIKVKDGRTTGVVLEGGEEIDAPVVSSSVDPHRTFLKMVEPGVLEADFLSEVRRYKLRGSSGKVNLALDGLPDFTAMPGPGPHLRGAMSISPSVDYMERAYDQAKYGEFSTHPYIDMVIPSLTDPSVAPPGKHILSCFVQYA